jgi:hypothetical protein
MWMWIRNPTGVLKHPETSDDRETLLPLEMKRQRKETITKEQ